MKDRLYAWLSLNGSTLGVLALIVVAVILLTGCNTVAGVGTDITKSAEWTKDKISGNKTSSTTNQGTVTK
jgi:predicted small secreted protein